jgi:hypothetical protein
VVGTLLDHSVENSNQFEPIEKVRKRFSYCFGKDNAVFGIDDRYKYFLIVSLATVLI